MTTITVWRFLIAFAAALAPITLVGLALVIVVLAALWWRASFVKQRSLVPSYRRRFKSQLIKAVIVTFGEIAAFQQSIQIQLIINLKATKTIAIELQQTLQVAACLNARTLVDHTTLSGKLPSATTFLAG